MKLTSKLTLALAGTILVVLTVNSFIRVEREVTLFENDLRSDHRVLARAVAGAAALVHRTVGVEQALELVEDANVRESHLLIRWVWLDLAPGATGAAGVPPERIDRSPGQPVTHVRARAEDGVDSLFTYVPLDPSGVRPAAIELRESLAPERAYVRSTIRHAAVATVVLVALCSLLAMGLGVAFVGRPVARLVAQARRVGAGDLTSRLRPVRRDEIGELALEMDSMCDRLAEARDRLTRESDARIAVIEQLRHADRLSTVGKLAAGVAHEIGTPLHVIGGQAEVIRDAHRPGTAAHDGAIVISTQTRRVTAIIRQLLDFARRRSPQKERQDLRDVAEQAMHLVESLAHRRGATVAFARPDGPVHAEVDAGQIQQAVTNLLVNGIQAMPSGGEVAVSLTIGRRRPPPEAAGPEAPFARLAIRDAGTGIAPEVRDRIFEPFFTTKEIGEGTGLGLSVTYGIVSEHGGWIEVDTAVGAGSTFTVYLPAVGA